MPPLTKPDQRSRSAPAPVGVGIVYQDGLRSFIQGHADVLDYLEVVPDTCWFDRGSAQGTPRYLDNQEVTRALHAVGQELPLVAHSIGQSIGSADHFDREHLAQIRRWYERFGFAWHSDHLSFHRVEHGAVNIGLTLPLTRDRETLDRLSARVREIRQSVPTAFLLETNVYFFDLPQQEYDEATFLNVLCRESGCGLLLDLHNVYANSINHGFSAEQLLDRLELEHVVEVHLASGFEHDGFYLDAHSGLTPEPVWALLERCLPRLTNLAGITFELFEDWIGGVDAAQLRGELVRMKDVWLRRPGRRAA